MMKKTREAKDTYSQTNEMVKNYLRYALNEHTVRYGCRTQTNSCMQSYKYTNAYNSNTFTHSLTHTKQNRFIDKLPNSSRIEVIYLTAFFSPNNLKNKHTSMSTFSH